MAYITKAQLIKMIDDMAPFSQAESWDNIGLLIDSEKEYLKKVLVALEISDHVVEQAVRIRADAIITHHPIMLSPIKRLDYATEENRCIMRMIRNGIIHIVAHTNLDASDVGTNARLAAGLGLVDIAPFASGMGRTGKLPVSMSLRKLAERVDELLGYGNVRLAGDEDSEITTVAVVAGSGMSLAGEAVAAGADVLVTGDARHHNSAEAVGGGLCIIDAGHFETERPAMKDVIEYLQSHYYELQCNVANDEVTEFCLADERSVLRPLR